MLEYRFPCALHIDQNCLSKVPPQKYVGRSVRFGNEFRFQVGTSDIERIWDEEYNLVVILTNG